MRQEERRRGSLPIVGYYYSNHSAVFNIELICSHGYIHPHPGPNRVIIGTMIATWLMEIDTADLIYLSSMLIQEA